MSAAFGSAPGDPNFVHEDAMVVEQNPRWTAVDEFIIPHLCPPSGPYQAAIEHALQNSLNKGLPDISVAPTQGKFLAIQCQIIGAKRILEIGTLGGYSTIWMASSSPTVQVTSIEIDEDIAAVARENIRFAGLEERVEVIVGAAHDVLPKLADEIEQGKKPKFDFSFIDADKASALSYFESALKMSRSGACIYLDNMVRKGLVAHEELAKRDENVNGIRKAIEAIGRNEKVNAVVIQTVSNKNYDGFLLAKVH